MKKPTGWMSNCPGETISHTLLRKEGGVPGRNARNAAVYPSQLCKAIFPGLKHQLIFDGRIAKSSCGILEQYYAIDDSKVEQLCAEMFGLDYLNVNVCSFAICVNNIDGGRRPEIFRDSVTGRVLDPTLVRIARRKEMKYFKSKNVWIKKPVSEAYERMGKAPITVNWVDVIKGDGIELN